jgi:hypothetical protein
MFCENCGNKNQEGHKFCTKCGHLVDSTKEKTNFVKQTPLTLNEKWWHRLLKVLYIVGYLPLLLIIPLVWSENSCYYCSDGDAFWYSLLTLVIYVAIIRLIKVAVLYVAMGRRPEWKKEFKKLF